MTLQEIAWEILNLKKLSKRLWAETLNTTCYIINHVYLRPSTKKTPYELWKGKNPNLGYFYIFGSMCFILIDHDHLGKFDSKSDKGVFLSYSNNNRALYVYDMRTQSIIEYANVVIDDYQDFIDCSVEEEITSHFGNTKGCYSYSHK